MDFGAFQENTYRSIVVLTGAGISAESGIKTFRASDGLWENHRIEDVATPEAFERDPVLVQTFYNTRRRDLLNGKQPNAAHIALAEFQQRFPDRLTIVTQNIDNLHELGGSEKVIHMHGELLKARCMLSQRTFAWQEDIDNKTPCPCCNNTGTLRPHIVWFNEMPLHMREIEEALNYCDLFISIGTSGNVYPAAGFFQLAKSCGADTVELNLEPSMNASAFDGSFQGPASELVPAFLQQLQSP